MKAGGILRHFAAVSVGALLSACGAAEVVWSSDAELAAARYESSAPPYVALLTMVTKRNEMGAHSALLVNGSQVALYDPAGTFQHPKAPERNDVFYGMTPAMQEVYNYYHARKSTYVVRQELPVTREFADRVLARMEAQGPSPKMYCAINTAEILQSFPEFAHFPRTFQPGGIMAAFGAVPGVKTSRITDSDVGQNIKLVVVNNDAP